MNIVMLLEMAAGAADPDQIAIGSRMGGGLSYRGLFDLAGRLARHLRSRPVERVLYVAESSPSLPVALFGSAWAGLPFVPVNYRLADDRLRTLVSGQAPGIAICDVAVEARLSGLDGIELVTTDGVLEALSSVDSAPEDWPDDPDAVAVLLHTSGTSGAPKQAVLRHRHLVSYVIGSVEFLGAGSDEATLVSVPPYHIAGVSAMLTATFGGRRLVQLPAFTADGWVATARREDITHAMTVPTMLARILDVLDPHVGGDGAGLPSVRHISYGGGRMPVPVIERALRLLPGVDFVNAYGLTETSSSIAVLTAEDHRTALASDDPDMRRRLGSVGRPIPTVEITVRDESGATVPAGRRGEIWVRGDQVSGEYANQSSEPVAHDGWFATHDGGWFDQDGYLYVEGRVDDVIVRGGENLSPGEIEDVLLDHPAVREAAVVGVPDEEWGEVVGAVVVLHGGATATPAELTDWVVANLRSSRRPTLVEIRDTLPMTETGKVLRRVLRDQLTTTSEVHPSERRACGGNDVDRTP